MYYTVHDLKWEIKFKKRERERKREMGKTREAGTDGGRKGQREN